MEKHEAEVWGDGRTVWVNSGTTGACLGRFGPTGIDIHHDIDLQRNGGECLDCTHHTPDLADWRRFVDGMKKHYGIDVSDNYRPRWLEPGAPRPRWF